MYIRTGYYGVTVDGVKAMLAASLTAFAMSKQISAVFEEGSSTCDIKRQYINP